MAVKKEIVDVWVVNGREYKDQTTAMMALVTDVILSVMEQHPELQGLSPEAALKIIDSRPALHDAFEHALQSKDTPELMSRKLDHDLVDRLEANTEALRAAATSGGSARMQ